MGVAVSLLYGEFIASARVRFVECFFRKLAIDIQAYRRSRWGCGEHGSHEAVRNLLPTEEDFSFGIARLERPPPIDIGGWVQQVHDDTSRVEAQPLVESFERTFLSTPEQCENQRLTRRSGMRNQPLFFGGEIVGDESVAARLNQLQIASQVRSVQSHSADRSASPMAEGDCQGRGLVLEENFGSTRGRRADFDFHKLRRGLRQIQTNGDSMLCRPAAKSPAGAAKRKAKSSKKSSLVRAEPIILSRNLRLGLLQPVNIHRNRPIPRAGIRRLAALQRLPRRALFLLRQVRAPEPAGSAAFPLSQSRARWPE